MLTPFSTFASFSTLIVYFSICFSCISRLLSLSCSWWPVIYVTIFRGNIFIFYRSWFNFQLNQFHPLLLHPPPPHSLPYLQCRYVLLEDNSFSSAPAPCICDIRANAPSLLLSSASHLKVTVSLGDPLHFFLTFVRILKYRNPTTAGFRFYLQPRSHGGPLN